MKYTNCYKKVTSSDFFLYIFIGGRGIGKTYSMLSETRKHNKNIIYLRRNDTELKFCCSSAKNPYKKINSNNQLKIELDSHGDDVYIVDRTDEDNEKIIGYAGALSTAGKFRGSDYSDVDIVVFDEFIDKNGRNLIKNEFINFCDLLETINRNRELDDEEPIKVVLLSNANTIDNEIIRGFNLGEEIRKLQVSESDHKVYTDDDRGIYLEMLDNKEVKDAKEKTRLYKLTKGTSFYEMALNNEFTGDYFGDVRNVNYNEFIPLCCYDNIYFYQHKDKDIIFTSYRKAKMTKDKIYNNRQLQAFKRDWGYMIQYYIEKGLILYLNYNVKLDVKNIW